MLVERIARPTPVGYAPRNGRVRPIGPRGSGGAPSLLKRLGTQAFQAEMTDRKTRSVSPGLSVRVRQGIWGGAHNL